MKKKQFLLPFLAVFLFASWSFAQNGSTEKIGRQPVNANYAPEHQTHDSKFKEDKNNSTSKIIDNLNNPEETVVVDGMGPLEQAKNALENYQAILLTPDYAEIPFKKGTTTYRIPVINNSPHYKLDHPFIQGHYPALVSQCVTATGHVPHSIQLKHELGDQCCAFFYYLSAIPQGRSLYIGKLNAGCVRIPVNINVDLYGYVSAN